MDVGVEGIPSAAGGPRPGRPRASRLMNNCYANYGTTNAREIAALLADG
jgi:hypothetical protein